MSSEEAALRRLEAAYVNLGGLALSRYDGVVDDLTKARAEKAAALDAYRTAIERRVLAQQPCQKHVLNQACGCRTQTNCKWFLTSTRCTPCKARAEEAARQTQETSG